jgi:hypothetical protein
MATWIVKLLTACKLSVTTKKSQAILYKDEIVANVFTITITLVAI